MPVKTPSTAAFPYEPARPEVGYRKPVRGSIVWWLRCIGVIAFVVVLLGLPQSRDAEVPKIDLRWLGVCMLLTMLFLLVEAGVWQLLLRRQRIPHPYPRTLVAHLASQYLGMVTPGHVGEFLAAGYISMNTGITFGYALSSVVMKKMLAWLTLMGFGIWGLQIVGQVTFAQGVKGLAVGTGIVLVILAIGISLWVLSLRRLARKWRRLSPWQVDMTEFWAGMRQLASSSLLVPLGVAVAGFSILFLQLDAILLSLGLALPFPVVAQILACSRLVARVIPLSALGWGSKDAAVIGLLAQQGISPAVGLTVTLLYLACTYLVTLLISGLCWWVKPLVLPHTKPAQP
ncbi:MAG TPA: lysylphosphatidylglycerol synthase transmembrane domain-containing protein [bacterium]